MRLPRRPTPPLPAPVERPAPLSPARVGQCLAAQDYRVRDEDGTSTGVWGKDQYWFSCLGDRGDILQVRARWHRTLPADRRSGVLLVLNDWHRVRTWPKAYLRPVADRVAVYAEVSVDLAGGVTDAQLLGIVICGLSTAGALFASLEAQLPEDASAPR